MMSISARTCKAHNNNILMKSSHDQSHWIHELNVNINTSKLFGISVEGCNRIKMKHFFLFCFSANFYLQELFGQTKIMPIAMCIGERDGKKERKADRHKESVWNDNAHLADKVRIHKWIHLIFTMCSKFRARKFRRERLER